MEDFPPDLNFQFVLSRRGYGLSVPWLWLCGSPGPPHSDSEYDRRNQGEPSANPNSPQQNSLPSIHMAIQ